MKRIILFITLFLYAIYGFSQRPIDTNYIFKGELINKPLTGYGADTVRGIKIINQNSTGHSGILFISNEDSASIINKSGGILEISSEDTIIFSPYVSIKKNLKVGDTIFVNGDTLSNFSFAPTLDSIFHNGDTIALSTASSGGGGADTTYGAITILRKNKSDTLISDINEIVNTSLFPDADSICVIVNQGYYGTATSGLYRASIKYYDINGYIVNGSGGVLFDITADSRFVSSKRTGHIVSSENIFITTNSTSNDIIINGLRFTQTGATKYVLYQFGIKSNNIDFSDNICYTAGGNVNISYSSSTGNYRFNNNYMYSTNLYNISFTAMGNVVISGGVYQNTTSEWSIYLSKVQQESTITGITDKSTNSIYWDCTGIVEGVQCGNIEINDGGNNQVREQYINGVFDNVKQNGIYTTTYVTGLCNSLTVSQNGGRLFFDGAVVTQSNSSYISITGSNSLLSITGTVSSNAYTTTTSTAGKLIFKDVTFMWNQAYYRNFITHTGTLVLENVNYKWSYNLASKFVPFTINGILDMSNTHISYDNTDATPAYDTTGYCIEFNGNSTFIDRGGNMLISDTSAFSIYTGAFTVDRYGLGDSYGTEHRPNTPTMPHEPVNAPFNDVINTGGGTFNKEDDLFDLINY